ncbi:MAG: hypothetical protein IPO93_11325 [Actinobacteria bacterium]|nr:hypothetical protein [Actinomycetota bacterium]
MIRLRAVDRNGPQAALDTGSVAILAAILIPVFLVFAAITLDIGRWYIEIAKVQAAADAAALSGVTWMPDNLSTPVGGPNATTKAIEASARNGYPNSGSSSVEVLGMSESSSQLLVTVSSTIPNIFGQIIPGISDSTTIRRSSLADVQGAPPMGSPCNAFGNQPDSNTYAEANGDVGPPGTAIPTTGEGGHATCQDSPQLWAVIQGPGEDKSNGDRYATTDCSSPTNCDSNPPVANPPAYGNKEYLAENYFWRVRIEPDAVGNDVSLQVYDPAYVETESSCENLDNAGSDRIDVNGINDWAPDASTRYKSGANVFCPGDRLDTSGSAMITSFALRAPTPTLDPLQSAPVSGCARQFTGTTDTPTRTQLLQGQSGYNSYLASVFHQWVHLCTFRPTEPGDYYLQVRTNVASGGNAATSPAITTGLEPGVNGFAMRAAVFAPDGTLNRAAAGQVSISGYERMPIRVNSGTTTTTFNLLQVLTNAHGKSFNFSFFDVGDGLGSNTGYAQILYPRGATVGGTTITGDVSPADCEYEFPVSGNSGTLSSSCTAEIRSSTNNGTIAQMTVDIPGDYVCTYQTLGSCWFTVKMTYTGTSNPTDTTTWDASINGDLVRLVK